MNVKEVPDCVVLVKDKPVSPFPTVFYNYGLSTDLKKFLDENLTCILVQFKNAEMKWCVSKEEALSLGVTAFEKIKEEHGFFDSVYGEVIEACVQTVGAAQESADCDYSGISNSRLLGLYWNFGSGMRRLTSSGLVFTFIDNPNNLLTDELNSILSKHLPASEVPTAFTMLTTPLEESFVKRERRELLELGVLIEKQSPDLLGLTSNEFLARLPSNKIISDVFERHYASFYWLSYGYEGPILSRAELAEKILVAKAEGFQQSLKKIIEAEENVVKNQSRFEGLLSDYEKYLFDCSRKIVFLKGYRKEMAFKAYCLMEKWLVETSKKFGVSVEDLRMFSAEETEELILNGQIPENLESRKKLCVLLTFNGAHSLVSGKDAELLSAKITPERGSVEGNALKGNCACPGFAIGIARIVNTIEDLGKMQKGDVLVSSQTNPNLMPAIGKASAIVTDIGGITSHAAIVSRELQIPCVIGTRIATAWLRDGEVVEVDASNGLVRKVG